MDRFDRIFLLHKILSESRRPVPRVKIEERLECSRATAKRIIEDMRIYLNAPIVYDREANGYRYEQNPQEGEMFELPGIWFNASELHALLSVQKMLETVQPGLLTESLNPLRQRIENLLQTQQGPGLNNGDFLARLRILSMAERMPGEHFQTVAGAVAQRKRLKIRYYSRGNDEQTEREISPQRLTRYRDNWYLDAYCHLRDDLRTFSVDAITSVQTLDEAALDIPFEELQAHYSGAYGIFAGQPKMTAVIRFSPEAARWVSKEHWHDEQKGEFLDSGEYELSLLVSNPTELLMDVLRYGPDAEIVSPPSLRAQAQEKLAATLTKYKEQAAA